MVKVGDKIKIIHLDGEPEYLGNVGIVEYIDDIGQIHGSWDGCALIPGFDRRGLYWMMQFYETYKDNEKVSTLLSQINWI